MTLAPAIKVLMTEDVAADAELELRELKRAGLRVAHRIVDREETFVSALREFAPDVILSDFSMPGFDGMSALALAREISPEIPFVFVSGTIGEEYAIRAMKNGATDYVLKTNLVRLPAAVERALSEARARREKQHTQADLDSARERLTSIFASLPDMLWSVDASTGQVIYVSPAAAEIYGYPPEDFVASKDLRTQVIHAEDRDRALAGWHHALQGGLLDVEYRVVRADGTLRTISDRGRLIRRPDGTPERVDGLARDISAEVRQRQRIERLSRVRDLHAALNAVIVRVRDRKLLFDEFARIAVSTGGFALARILELDRNGVLRVAATTETEPAKIEGIVERYNRDAASSRSLIAMALRSGETVFSNDVANDPRVEDREGFTGDGNHSVAFLPAMVENRIAAVVVLRAQPGFFDHEEMAVLCEMVSNISFTLELLDKQDRIAYLALYDGLTGLPNRTLFGDHLGNAIETVRRDGGTLALALIDIERFKAINDTLGAQFGDRVLQAVARRLKDSAGDINRVARLGSNLFALVFEHASNVDEIARRIEHEATAILGQPLHIDGRELTLAAKAGVAVYPDDGADSDALFRNAEAALKQAKETGERYLFYAPHLNARVAEQVELENRLRKAVDHGELFLHFQPKLDLATGRMVGMEALIRWKGPDGVLVSPAKFVPILEQTGLILEAGRQAIAIAATTYRGWQLRNLAPPRIAVNVSALQLRRRSFVSDVHHALGHLGDDGGGIDLEITESLLMTDVDESIRKLRELRDLGMHIALDDFGTGYSSLAYLSKLPLDTLKIDRGFVRGMTENTGDTSIIATIISLAQALRLKVVAEGVESEQQAQLLRLLRCDQAQGYLFGPPMAVERMESQLAAPAA